MITENFFFYKLNLKINAKSIDFLFSMEQDF